ncbi:unnamed protein product, partial [Notodromas monacha]
MKRGQLNLRLQKDQTETWSTTTTTTTRFSDVPSGAPTIVRATNASSTSIFVRWAPPKADSLHGELLGYRLTDWGRGNSEVPSGAPTIVRATNASSTSIFVRWAPPKADSLHGELLGYRLTCEQRQTPPLQQQRSSQVAAAAVFDIKGPAAT